MVETMKKIGFILILIAVVACGKSPEGTTPGDCSDSKDNDANGFVDCEDDGCNLDDYCIKLAAKALAQQEEQPAEPAPPKQPTADPNAAFHNMEDLLVQNGMSESDMTYNQAENYCKKLVISDKGEWRLPTKEEALGAYEKKLLPETASVVIWTSDKEGSKRRYVVGVSSGAPNHLAANSKGDCRALCVRDGQ